jgi:hypothetical protein
LEASKKKAKIDDGLKIFRSELAFSGKIIAGITHEIKNGQSLLSGIVHGDQPEFVLKPIFVGTARYRFAVPLQYVQ